MHKKYALMSLRISLGITFFWIGILILQNPLVFAGYMQPWAAKLLPVPAEQALTTTGVLDMVIGLMLLFNWQTYIAAGLAAIHLVTVLIVSGIDSVTIRDVGLIGASTSLFFDTAPEKVLKKLKL